MQRCSSHICSKTDIDEAEEIGSAGVKAALAGKTGKMMIFKRISDVPYVVTVDSVDAHDAANKEKFFPAQWLSRKILPATYPRRGKNSNEKRYARSFQAVSVNSFLCKL